ncbi:MAG: hypothetical protein ACKVX7_05890 [Planctomycetota bacterium]
MVSWRRWMLPGVCAVLVFSIAWRVFAASTSSATDNLELGLNLLRQLALERSQDPADVTREPLAAGHMPAEFHRIQEVGLFGRSPAAASAATVEPALKGTSNERAFVQLPSGTVVLLRVGEERDGIKLIAVAPNRALIEHGGKQQELTIYSGLGSDTLLTPEKGLQP